MAIGGSRSYRQADHFKKNALMIVLIIVIAAFVNRAGELDLNKWLWGAIGFAVFGGSQVVIGVAAALWYDMMGEDISGGPETTLNLIGALISGLIAYAVYNRMPRYVANQQEENRKDLLDDDIFR